MPKIQNFKFLFLTTLVETLNNFNRDPSHEYTWILGSKSGVYLQRRCLKLLLPYYGNLVNENDKNWQKSKIWISQLWTTYGPKKEQKRKKKAKNSKFQISRRMHDLGERVSFALSEEISFEIFTPIWSHVNKNEKKKKNQKLKILKKKMVWRYGRQVFHKIWLSRQSLFSKFIRLMVRKVFYRQTDVRRRTDARMMI